MKKIFSVLLIGTFLTYALYVYQSSQLPSTQTPLPFVSQPAANNANSTNPATTYTPPPVTQTQPSTPTPVSTPTPTSTPTPVPVPKQVGLYKDGTFTGNSIDAYYGFVQVAAVIKNGRLSTVNILNYPQDRSTSREINSQALPMLISEAISAQSANISDVSGASETSPAFKQSLASALAQAKN